MSLFPSLISVLLLSRIVYTFAEPFQIGGHFPIHISSGSLTDVDPKIERNGKAIKKTYTIYHQYATYLSVHFAEFDFDPECWMIISDAAGSQEAFLAGYGRNNLSVFWAPHVEHDTMKLELNCDDESKKAHFVIDDYVAGYQNIEKDRGKERKRKVRGNNNLFLHRALAVCDSNELRNAQCYKDEFPIEYNSSRAVARVLVEGAGVCTGFLLRNNLLITNQHCIKTNEQALNSDYSFMYESSDGDCNTSGINEFSGGHKLYYAKELVSVSKEYDYSIVRLYDNPTSVYGYLDLDNRRPAIGEMIYIPQHPLGRDKAIGIYDSSAPGGKCQIQSNNFKSCFSVPHDDVGYTCDTEAGSSGSPIISIETNKVVAMHHCGGGCNNNKGTPIVEIYDELARFIDEDDSTAYYNQCSEGHLFTLKLQTDEYAVENSWDIKDGDGRIVFEGSGYNGNELVDISRCLAVKNGVHTWTLYDSAGDGICCNSGNGSYQISIDGVPFATGDGIFERTVVLELPTDISSAPSVTVSNEPTISPSNLPSMKPSLAPSFQPTMVPSVIPTGPTSSAHINGFQIWMLLAPSTFFLFCRIVYS